MYKHETILKAAGQGTVSAGIRDKATVKIHVINDCVDQEGGDDHSDKPQKESCGLDLQPQPHLFSMTLLTQVSLDAQFLAH